MIRKTELGIKRQGILSDIIVLLPKGLNQIPVIGIKEIMLKVGRIPFSVKGRDGIKSAYFPKDLARGEIGDLGGHFIQYFEAVTIIEIID